MRPRLLHSKPLPKRFLFHPGSKTAGPLAVDAALGTIDGMEILGYANAEVSTDIYHRLLNCGFQLTAAAGTDTFNNIRRHKVIGGIASTSIRKASSLTRTGSKG